MTSNSKGKARLVPAAILALCTILTGALALRDGSTLMALCLVLCAVCTTMVLFLTL